MPLPNPAETRWYIVFWLCNSSASFVILENCWVNVGQPVGSGHAWDAVVGATVHGGEGGHVTCVGSSAVVHGSDSGQFFGVTSGQTQAVTVVPTIACVGAGVHAGQTVVVTGVEHFSGSGDGGQGVGGGGAGQSHEAPAVV